MSGAQRTRRPSTRIQLSPKQANIYAWGWQKDARFRYAVCGRRFGKTYLGAEEMRRAYRLAVEHNIHPDNEIWYGAPTSKQAKRVMWNRLKRNIPEDWIQGRPNNTECVMQMRTGHVMRVVGLDAPDALRGSGLWCFLGDEWDDAKPVILPEIHDGIATRACRCAPSKISARPRAPASTTAFTSSRSSSRRLDSPLCNARVETGQRRGIGIVKRLLDWAGEAAQWIALLGCLPASGAAF
jgi:hypothetical protein